jgi:pimeloyl-ACP methyl ester carboxylesterase
MVPGIRSLAFTALGAPPAFWSDAAAELATRGRTIVCDRRGHFRSERPEPYATNVHEQADDAAALIDALAATPAIVIGRSYGGEIAIDLALPRSRARVGAAGGRRWAVAERDGNAGTGGALGAVFAAADTDMSTVGETEIRLALGDDACGRACPTRARRSSRATARDRRRAPGWLSGRHP